MALESKETWVLFTPSVNASSHAAFGVPVVNKSSNGIKVNLTANTMTLKIIKS